LVGVRIATEALWFAYGGEPVLKDISLDVGEGRLVCLIGPNGSGKSTFLRILARILKPQKGSVYLDGRSMARFASRDLGKMIGYVPQHGSQLFSTRVFEVVMMGRKPHLSFRVSARDRRVVMETLGLLSMSGFVSRFFDELSGGEKQKVLLARALAQETGILLLDEPTSDLDPKYQLDVMTLLKRLQQDRGLTIVVALHDLNLAARFADFVVMMHQGRIFAQGPPAEVLNEENIACVYQIEARILEDGRGGRVIAAERAMASDGDVS